MATKPIYSTELQKCIALQIYVAQLIETSVFKDDEARALGVGRLVHAWTELAERRRILKGKPLPGEALRILRDPIALKKIAQHAGFEQRPAAMIAGEFTDLDAVDTKTVSNENPLPDSPLQVPKP